MTIELLNLNGGGFVFVAIILITVLLTWKFADWRNWQKYQSTMLLFSLGNLLYIFIYHDHFLWMFKPDIFNHHIMEIIYTVTVFPLTTLMFISNFPYGNKKLIFYMAKYIFIYITVEYILFRMGYMVYNYGWNIWWSLGWNVMMFSILAIHYKKPLHAYSISVLVFLLMNRLFQFKLD